MWNTCVVARLHLAFDCFRSVPYFHHRYCRVGNRAPECNVSLNPAVFDQRGKALTYKQSWNTLDYVAVYLRGLVVYSCDESHHLYLIRSLVTTSMICERTKVYPWDGCEMILDNKQLTALSVRRPVCAFSVRNYPTLALVDIPLIKIYPVGSFLKYMAANIKIWF